MKKRVWFVAYDPPEDDPISMRRTTNVSFNVDRAEDFLEQYETARSSGAIPKNSTILRIGYVVLGEDTEQDTVVEVYNARNGHGEN